MPPDSPAAAELAERFDHVLVDEFQDTNSVQYRLVRFLSQAHPQHHRGRRRGSVDLQVARAPTSATSSTSSATTRARRW